MEDTASFFRKALLDWSAAHLRPLPWKGEPDPYRIWLSEIILQQTRVEQGLPYYERFVTTYPTVRHLADAPEDQLMKLWEGLGYYSRARNLHAAARHIAHELGGQFPQNYAGIRNLRGVGDYTAAAIASFAYGLPHAVLDGNVYRVLARFFGIATPTDTPQAKREFTTIANQLLDTEQPGAFNQAIMDFGATWCKPRQPRCAECPMASRCAALATGRVADLPIKSKKMVKKERHFLYLVLRWQGDTWVRKRTEKDIWQNLFEFPLLESDALPADARAAAEQLAQNTDIPETWLTDARLSPTFRQTLTHREVAAAFFEIHLPAEPTALLQLPFFAGCQRERHSDLKKKFAFPRIVDRYLQESAVILTLF